MELFSSFKGGDGRHLAGGRGNILYTWREVVKKKDHFQRRRMEFLLKCWRGAKFLHRAERGDKNNQIYENVFPPLVINNPFLTQKNRSHKKL